MRTVTEQVMTAMGAYTTSKRLPLNDCRVINIDTVKALGVSPNQAVALLPQKEPHLQLFF